ncbi:hypothetical protein ACP275_11G064700 [Erythranthe tilingii]
MNPRITTIFAVYILLVTFFKVDGVNVDRLPFMVNTNDVSSSKDTITVQPCTSTCEVACCYCNIHRNPPVCEKCCPLPPAKY